MTLQRTFPLVLLTTALYVGTGCNTSRYGITYDQRLPSIQSVEIRVNSLQVASRHSGGDLENRPDIAAEVRERLLKELQERITEKGFAVRAAPSTATDPSSNPVILVRAVALTNAVSQSIYTHHYEYGGAKEFDYTVGDTVEQMHATPCDAVLAVYLQASVPTSGRQALKATAFVVGVITGIRFHVSTSEAEITLMLIDAESGTVLWYDRYLTETDVRKDRSLRRLVKRISKYLLEPRKK